jgi:trehalose utilization protein
MNIIIEDNIDFYKQLHELDSEEEDDDDQICLLTKIPLDQNKIVLPCNHSFNLYPLYKEVCNQKLRTSTSYLETNRLNFNQMKCPYCRQIFDFVLPHVRINKKMGFHNGVNSPEKICMTSFHSCSHVLKSGKQKDTPCGKIGYYTEHGCYCMTHQTSVAKRISITNNKINNVLGSLHTCNAILQSGNRKGELCNANISNSETSVCRRHNKNKVNVKVPTLSS